MSNSSYLIHYGILGMKWGVRKDRSTSGKRSYSSRGVRATIARRKNAKVDASFQAWKTGSQNRENAIEAGKQLNQLKRQLANDPNNKELKKQVKDAEKAYKQAYKQNTIYRKGQVRQEVGSDLARKYLSEAKKVGKELDKDPGNKELQKKYNKLMSQHDIEREKARRAVSVASNRSAKVASMKRAATMTVKAAAATAAVGVGVKAINKYTNVNISVGDIHNFADIVNKGRTILSYFY